MAIARTVKGIIRTVRAHYTKRRQYAELRECDPRMLRDIGLRWERGRLVPLNPEWEPEGTARRHKVDTRDTYETCPRCGSKLT